MPKNTTTFNFKNWPKALAAAALLVVLTEGYVWSVRPALVKDYWNKFLINEGALIDGSKDHRYLILGNSTQKTGIRAAEVSPELLNLGLAGSKPMGHYLLLKRYLERHTPPETIFLFVDPEDQADSFLVILRYFVSWKECFSIWPDLTWQERRVFLGRHFSSLDLRKVNLTRRTPYVGSNKSFVSAMIRNKGYMPAPDFPDEITADYHSRHRRRVREDVVFTVRDEKYLDKTLELAASKGIRIAFLPMMLPEELERLLRAKGFLARYDELMAEIGRRHPGAAMPGANTLVFPNNYFEDPNHLNRKGSDILTEAFGGQFRASPEESVS